MEQTKEPVTKKARIESNAPVVDASSFVASEGVPGVASDIKDEEVSAKNEGVVNLVEDVEAVVEDAQAEVEETTVEVEETESKVAHRLTNEFLAAKEVACGIVLFVNALDNGFSGEVKARYSDFLVNEIDSNGEVIRLKSTKAAPKVNAVAVVEEEEVAVELTQEEVYVQLALHIGASQADEVRLFVETPADTFSVDAESITTKAKRTEVHLFFKTHFAGLFKTMTTEGKFTIIKSDGARDYREVSRKATTAAIWGDNNYCHFTLMKENRDTMTAVMDVAWALKSDKRSFGFSGTKDKRGITVQRVSVYRIAESQVLSVNRKLQNLRVGDCVYSKSELRLGDLKGNRFQMAIRQINQESIPEIKLRIETLKESGFINYYGLQRFGTGSIPTHAIGLMVLRGDFKGAIELLLSVSDHEDKAHDARVCWRDEKNAKKAAQMFPKFCVAEKAILSHFQKKNCATDYLGAFSQISRNLRLMYVHAYQSYVWNHMVTLRLHMFGIAPIVGDIVLVEKEPKILTEADLCDYTITDIVLPLPGTDMIYPENAIKQAYIDLMAKEEMCPFNMERTFANGKDYSLAGSYRGIFGVVKDVEVEFVEYEHENDQLLLNDLEVMQGKTLGGAGAGGLHALKIGFSLDSAHYATMAIRELMKSQGGKD